MSAFNFDEEKLNYTSDDDDEKCNPLSMFWREYAHLRKPMYQQIVDRADRYLENYCAGNPDDWFGRWWYFDEDLHAMLGVYAQ